MSPRRTRTNDPPRVADTIIRVRVKLGRDAYEARRRRRWTLADVALRAGVSVATAQRIEAGRPVSLEACVRAAVALNLEPDFGLRSAGQAQLALDADPVHAAMGEVLAGQLAGSGRALMLDEPYQHYQFAGRADVLVVDVEARAMLHVENRTRFSDVQAFAGSWNAKRSYLAPQIARRLAVRGGFASVDHVVAALWSSEVLHAIRLRRASFRALAPDDSSAFLAWWSGGTPTPGTRSSLVLFDPLAGERRSRRRWMGMDRLDGLGPRYRGYAEAAQALRNAGKA